MYRLQAISRKGDWNGWISFFLQAVLDQAEENNRKARAIIELFNKMKISVPEITHSQYAVQALDGDFDRPIFSSSKFRRTFWYTRDTALRILRLLAKAKCC